MMQELELREKLSDMTIDMLVEIIVELLHLISALNREVKIYEENKKCVAGDDFYGIDAIINACSSRRA